MELRIQNRIDDEPGYEAARQLRWGAGLQCAYCQSENIMKWGRDSKGRSLQRYDCKESSKPETVYQQTVMTFEEGRLVNEAQYDNMNKFSNRPLIDIHVDVGHDRARRIIDRL